MSRRGRVAVVAAAAGLGLGLAGCGVGDAVIGVHDAPVESPTGAPISGNSAETITARVLTLAADARVADGKKADRQRKAALTGPALEEARVKAAYRQVTNEAPGAVARPTEPTVLAISRTRAWPRAILATTLDDNGVQRLHVLTSSSASEPFKLYASVGMEPGATVPAVGPLADGAALVEGGDGLVAPPVRALRDYAQAIAFPTPKKTPDDVSTDDAFASTLMANAKAQSRQLDDLAKLHCTHKVDADSVIAFRLHDGSALVFGQMTRTDTIRTTSQAKELVLPSDLADLVGKKKVRKKLTLTTLETVAMHVPSDGPAKVVGAEEQRTSVAGS